MITNEAHRRLAQILCSLAIAMLAAGESAAWNDTVHRKYLREAVDSLPGPLKKFFEDREDALEEAISDPTRFPPRLLFEIDRLEPFPFDELPSNRTLAERKYGAEALEESGDVPWRLAEAYEALVEAFRAQDFDAVFNHSVAIAYYVGELYMPLNVSKDGDGEPTGQQGLRERFDSRLVEVYLDKIKIDSPNALYLDHPADYAVSMPLKSYVWVDNIVFFDYLSRKGVDSYDRFYYDGMWLRAQPVLESLLGAAALDTASYWYSAWVDARKPDLPRR